MNDTQSPDACRPVYCVAGPCADTCLRMDDPNPIELPPDRLARTARRIREAVEGLAGDGRPVSLHRAADLYHGRSAPTAAELAMYAEACGVSLDWLVAGVVPMRGFSARQSAPGCATGPGDIQAPEQPSEARTARPTPTAAPESDR